MTNGDYTTGELAKMLKVSQRTVLNWCDNGLLKCHKIGLGNHRRIVAASLEAFLARHPDFPVPESLRTARPSWIDAGAAEVALQLMLTGYYISKDELAAEVAKIMDHHRLESCRGTAP